ncbi:MAG TPA: GspMb/PilO family protein [Pyrinomonadaceae bacterium]|nr:GspMb/PilO family protein [Pyrinomonadaceae bacterium]
MSQEQPMQSRALAGRRQIRGRFDQLKRSPGLNVIGVPELVGLAGAALLALITIFAYFYFLVPAHSRLSSTQLDRDLLQGQVRASEGNLSKDTNTQKAVDEIKASLEDFEGNWLTAPGTGRMSLYSELNSLIRSNGLRNTSGPSYSTLAPAGTKSQTPAANASQQSKAKWQTIYPGIAVSVTVEGPYAKVRHFVRDIETSRQFLIINSVELESASQSGAIAESSTVPGPPVALRPSARAGRAAAPLSSTQPPVPRGALVSLRLDMATYFRLNETDNSAKP